MFILYLLVVLILIFVIRTALFRSKQVSIESLSNICIDTDKAATHLAEAVKFKTISYRDKDKIDYDEFIKFHDYLYKTYPNVHKSLQREVIKDYSLLYKWEGSDDQLKPILLMAHMDVVPVEPGTEKDWKYAAFDGIIDDEYIWGRGTMDFKVGVIGILDAVETLLEEGYEPKRTIYLSFGHDEELGGGDGAYQIAKLFEQKKIEFECILDEGGLITEGMMPGVDKPVALIGIVEKGHVNVEISAKCSGGHSSMPPKHTAVGILSTAIHKLERNQMPARFSGPIRETFEYIGPEMSFFMKMIFANIWFFNPIIKKIFSSNPSTNALIRTTTATTMFSGSIKENVLPLKATAVVNFRIAPGDSISEVVQHVERIVKSEGISVQALEQPTIKTEPSNISDTQSGSFKAIEKAIGQVFPNVLVAPYVVVGGTDARHFKNLSKNIFRFIPMICNKDDIERTHGTNERIGIENFGECVKFYAQFIVNMDNIYL